MPSWHDAKLLPQGDERAEVPPSPSSREGLARFTASPHSPVDDLAHACHHRRVSMFEQLTFLEVADELALSVDEVRAMVRRGDLKAHRSVASSQWVVSRADLDNYLVIRMRTSRDH